VTALSAWRGAAAGVAAGLVAAAAMDMFQRGVAKKLRDSDNSGESATTRAADAVSEAATGEPVSKPRKATAGQAVHYGFGVLLGAGYGVLAEYWPRATIAAGAPFGLAAAALIDETAMPIAGLGDAPWKAPASTHAYSAASDLVFGTVAETTRRLARSVL
jgi:hypothetical protein